MFVMNKTNVKTANAVANINATKRDGVLSIGGGSSN
jgi:hypothetical protein